MSNTSPYSDEIFYSRAYIDACHYAHRALSIEGFFGAETPSFDEIVAQQLKRHAANAKATAAVKSTKALPPKSPIAPATNSKLVKDPPTTMTTPKRLTQQDIDKIVADAKAAREAHENDGLTQPQVDRLERFDRENGMGDHSRFCIATDEARGTQSVGISVAEARRRGMRIDKILKGSR